MLLSILLAQATAASPAIDFDLGKLAPATATCNPGNASPETEISVCARRRATDIPLKAMPIEPLLPRAEFKLFGQVRAKVAGERGSVGPIPTNRAMVTMSVPF